MTDRKREESAGAERAIKHPTAEGPRVRCGPIKKKDDMSEQLKPDMQIGTARHLARKMWGPQGFALHIQGRKEVGVFLGDPNKIPCPREIWGTGATWDEAFADATETARREVAKHLPDAK